MIAVALGFLVIIALLVKRWFTPGTKMVNSTDYRGTLYASVKVPEFESGVLFAMTRRLVPDDHLCTDEAVTNGKPRETSHHITIKVGIRPTVAVQELQSALRDAGIAPFWVTIGRRLGHFHNRGKFSDGKVHKRDVLFAEVEDEGGQLSAIRDAMRPFEVQDRPSDRLREYHPHVTLAFLKYGTAQAYVADKPRAGLPVRVDAVVLKMAGAKGQVEPMIVALE